MFFAVLLPATQLILTVLDPVTGLALKGLGVGDFVAAQPVEAVRVSDAPVAALLLVDSSSVGGVVRTTAEGLVPLLRPGDRMAIMSFTDRTALRQGFTDNAAALQSALGNLRYDGEPRMLDALGQAISTAFPTGRYHKVVILLTAGIEGPARTSESSVIRAASQKGIAVYPLYLHGSGRWVFGGLARDTGGAMFWLREVRDLAGIFETIRSPYIVTLRGGPGSVKLKGREKSFLSSRPFESK